ncbi:uncharacterized protein LOC117646854 [Thrips palmi]|uniref:Uncharacterized protein LOC117646854 n=1 Tax=Thrips palmi TaxID=161013 RepID=A0A6P8ZA75_THRPL|nr:uncharacterized protein LOC117646854 [Thrips palmi]
MAANASSSSTPKLANNNVLADVTARLQNTMAAFANLNTGEDFTSISTLRRFHPYETTNFERVGTSFGDKIKCIIKIEQGEEVPVILPSRLSKLTDEDLFNLNEAIAEGQPPLFSVQRQAKASVRRVFNVPFDELVVCCIHNE